VFSLGIVPYINASILFQLLATAFPSLKKLQREEGPQGRARFQVYQKAAALVFAVAQAVGQLSYLRPYVADFTPFWLFENTVYLTAGAMILVYVSSVGWCWCWWRWAWAWATGWLDAQSVWCCW
jgi:preprotein translocase subunit SecY